MSKKTKVAFYWDKPDGEAQQVFAVFPEIIEKEGHVMCYSHVGQHSCAHHDYIKECKPAEPVDYADLKKELEREFGYDLSVVPG